MTNEEWDVVRTVFDVSGGRQTVVPYDEIAVRLGTTITTVRTLAALLRVRNLAVVTFGGIQLTPSGLAEARLQQTA